jgi:aminocarboxymuconate-semialdehyde decarboxylase
VIIEWHNHVYPPEEAAHPEWEGRCPMSIENVLQANEQAGIDAIVVTNAAHYMRYKSDADELASIRRWTDYAAEIQNKHRGKVYCFATLLPCGGAPQLKEMERAVRELGLKGVFINSSHKGHYPDDDEARPFWELAQELDIPVMIHPPHVGFGEERMKEYRLASSVGRPFDLTLALSRLIVRGILEDFPRLKIVASHGGGGVCEVIGRMDYAYELRDEAYFLGSYKPLRIRHKPSHYLKMMYLDTVCYHAPAIRLVLDTVGIDHALYGSDAPPLTSLKPRAIQLVRELKLSREDSDKVFWRNAARLLKLPIAEQALAA